MNCRRQTGLFTESGPLKNPHLKLNTLGIIFQDKPGMLHEGRKRNPASDRRLVASIVN
jgi:hypothetical protein